MIKYIVGVLAAAALMGGCAQIDKIEDQGDEQIGKGIHAICENTSEEYRLERREGINKYADPHKLNGITCAD